jgi:hypothetical protein
VSNLSEINERLAADLLIGAEDIRAHLKLLGIEMELDGVYYAHKKKKLPISKFGNQLISTRSKITRHIQNLVA